MTKETANIAIRGLTAATLAVGGIGVEATAFSAPASAAVSDKCDNRPVRDVTVQPDKGIVTVPATRKHPTVIVVSSRTPGGTKDLRWRPTGNFDSHSTNPGKKSEQATVVMTAVPLKVDTQGGNGLWYRACEPTYEAGYTEAASRVKDVFKVDKPTKILELFIPAKDRYSDRTLTAIRTGKLRTHSMK